MIREALPADAAGIARVHLTAWQVAYAPALGAEWLGRQEPAAWARRWERNLAGQAARTFVAEREGRIAGFAGVSPARDEDAPGAGELRALYVAPIHWGSAVARELHAAALDALREDGYESAILRVLAANPRARRFYEREGWEQDGDPEPFELSGGTVAAVRYRRAL